MPISKWTFPAQWARWTRICCHLRVSTSWARKFFSQSCIWTVATSRTSIAIHISISRVISWWTRNVERWVWWWWATIAHRTRTTIQLSCSALKSMMTHFWWSLQCKVEYKYITRVEPSVNHQILVHLTATKGRWATTSTPSHQNKEPKTPASMRLQLSFYKTYRQTQIDPHATSKGGSFAHTHLKY